MYNGAGSQMHGGEYVQLTWLVSGSKLQCGAKRLGRSRSISKIDGAGALYLLSYQQVVAHSAHFHRVTRSGERIGRGLHGRLARIKTSELVAQLPVVYDYRGKDTKK